MKKNTTKIYNVKTVETYLENIRIQLVWFCTLQCFSDKDIKIY